VELCAGLGVGAFAEQTVVPVACVVPLPDGLPLPEAALLGCAVLTGFGAVHRTARVRPGESLVVIGVGGVGQSVLQAARLAGADPIVAVDEAGSREGIAYARGATHFYSRRTAAAREVLRLTGHIGADHVLDCVGARETIRLAWRLTRRGGVTTVVGIGSRSESVGFAAQELCTAGKSLVGCVYGNSVPKRDVPLLAEHVREGRFDLKSMIGPRVTLADLPDVLRDGDTSRDGRMLVMF
jgi:S-(hydroxymethyl)glutathione dehydrogenase/alcohol dehydrogenase